MRLVVARCEVRYSGRLSAVLPEALRLLMFKSDGSVMVHSDTGGFKPENWMTAPTIIEESDSEIVVRKVGAEDRLDIRLAEVVSDTSHDMGEAAALQKAGVERELQELLADSPETCGEGFRLVRREWPTDIGPVDLMCRDADEDWIAVEIKRVGTISAVDQLTRYLDRIRLDPSMGSCRGVLAPSRSSRRRACWPSRAGSTAWRWTSRCCEASASRTSRCSPDPRGDRSRPLVGLNTL